MITVIPATMAFAAMTPLPEGGFPRPATCRNEGHAICSSGQGAKTSRVDNSPGSCAANFRRRAELNEGISFPSTSTILRSDVLVPLSGPKECGPHPLLHILSLSSRLRAAVVCLVRCDFSRCRLIRRGLLCLAFAECCLSRCDFSCYCWMRLTVSFATMVSSSCLSHLDLSSCCFIRLNLSL